MTNEPLIYTVRGNLPLADLEYRTRWEDAPDYLKFVEMYLLDGEVVRESAHVYIKSGAVMTAEAEDTRE